MARPHIEFIQSQKLAWRDAEALGLPGARCKMLCHDDADGSFTALVRLPAGSKIAPRKDSGADWDDEAYVLEGDLTIGDLALRRHSYVYLPAAAGTGIEARTPTTLVLWRHVGPLPWRAPDGTGPLLIHTMEMPWDTDVWEKNLTHLRPARKTLRLGPDSTRTYLLAGLPHGYPATGRAGMEKHPYPEEMLMIAGDMWSPQGRMTRGAYFYRPPRISHGGHWSELGFLMIMRTPGANRPVTEWSEPQPIQQDNPFRPDLPPDAPHEIREEFVAFVDF